MRLLPIDEILILCFLALIFFALKKFLQNVSISNNAEKLEDISTPPPDPLSEAHKDLYNPERSYLPMNVHHREFNE